MRKRAVVALFALASGGVVTLKEQEPDLPNDSDRTSRSRGAALEGYRRFVPHYPLAPGPDAPIHQAFRVGRVVFLVTDCRSARSPRRLPEGERTMLGEPQRLWLEEQLEAARSAPLVVWVNSVPWITKRDESTKEGWAPFERERRRIADTIVRLGLVERLVMLSGDAHMLALDDGTHSQYSTLPGAPARGFVVAHAAPMDRRPTRKGGPTRTPRWRRTGSTASWTSPRRRRPGARAAAGHAGPARGPRHEARTREVRAGVGVPRLGRADGSLCP